MDVSFGLSSYSVPLSPFKQDVAVIRTIDYILTQAFNENPCELVLSDDERFRLLTVLKEIEEFLVVDLKERAIHREA